MIKLQEELLAKCNGEFVSLLSTLRSSQVLSSDSLSQVLGALEKIAEASRTVSCKDSTGIDSDLQNVKGWEHFVGKELTSEEAERFKVQAEEICLRIVATAIGSGHTMRSKDVAALYSGETTTHDRAPVIVHNPGEVISTEIDDNVIILLPSLHTKSLVDRASSGLIKVFDHTPSSYNWVVDFSVVENVPVVFLGNLVGYSQMLRSRNKDLFLCWLKKGAISEATEQSFVRLFNLTLIGGYWFSNR